MLLACAFGCESPSAYVPVRGTVTLDGKPVESGIVQFQPVAGQVAVGELGAGGGFSLTTQGKSEGVLAGTYKVTVIAYDPQASEQTPETLIVPLRYTRSGTSGLQVTIFPGSTSPLEIELVSDEPGGRGADAADNSPPAISLEVNDGAGPGDNLPDAPVPPAGAPPHEEDATSSRDG